ncbi:Predicted endonuclease distantly related to archaeal Holliday junction resolvase [hydrothermal vent metagenome]|uniref:Predicted endonuclease distantly related to archaeal Holliday junction resolvase n=1 Tax=hydrothermal vent metagenome TaxID=652676 RepID=A0A3B1E0J2_9ZZZZ
MSFAKGLIAEEKAANYLINKNFRVIDRNFYTKFGEIDIIAIKDNILYFVEVKSGDTFEPIYNITQAKLDKITKSIYVFLATKKLDIPYNISSIVIHKKNLDFIENITF